MLRIHIVHIITKNDTLEGGNVPDAQISFQMAVLNGDYANTGLSFKLVNTTRTTNAAWFDHLTLGSWVVISSLSAFTNQYIVQV